MQLAVVAAGFTPGESDQLRRSMAAWKRKGGLEHLEKRLLDGMRAHGYDDQFAQQIYQQILGFGEYGFPESHAASFALLVYVSSWLKHYEPAAFTCALLNSQPMGFYSPSQLTQDLRRHSVEIRRPMFASATGNARLNRRSRQSRFPIAGTQNRTRSVQPALRLGLCLVKGLARSRCQEACRCASGATVRQTWTISPIAQI